MTGSLRCAVYTRKSTEEGLDQPFNSLDAQREACEAYIRSQVGERWKLLPARYDDGGYSGGNLDRPAMQRLLTDVDAGNVDVIVVYKVDRLTRSLLDFVKVVERLDARDVSFVSVTQAFNTTTSMGRLTLNVLLSFAQFEREVTGERIRDKIAASKAKGMWMGGNVPLGYDLNERQLVVNSGEAAQVRYIFSRYVDLASGVALMKELQRGGIVTKLRVSRSGRQRGGVPFCCGGLYYLLQNRIYLGEIVHRGVRHKGNHEPIVSDAMFAAVERLLAENRQKRRAKPSRSTTCGLVGLVRDGQGHAVTTSFSYGRGGKRYAYYVIGSLDPSRTDPSARVTRVPAGRLHGLVLETLRRVLGRRVTIDHVSELTSAIELHQRSIHLLVRRGGIIEPHEPAEEVVRRLQPLMDCTRVVVERHALRLIIDRSPTLRGTSSPRLERSFGSHQYDGLRLLRRAHELLASHRMSPMETSAHASAAAPSCQRERRIMRLGLLAPHIQKALILGTSNVSVEQFLGDLVPLEWTQQLSSAP